ncbi:helix-turn-helix domain-containing protein [Xenorhabdus thuongxuanensis]|uniref:Transcriptional regulator n=1 Tax=Xenorhabdus thuongxuanensis TaxID=1873484 RepID=A0A1Q5U3U9_9GAMM|nr:helix-turn-helix transcriptional regulator [Xenorhabdus thuongxuanensis]OKP07160.1 transcriptional regulator [Xenorhabdus thuongxuanensis]
MSTQKNDVFITIGKRLREEREKIGASQDLMAKTFGVSTRTWGEYERGKTAPNAAMLSMLATEYGFDINYIITGIRAAPVIISVEEQALIEHYRAMSEESRASMRAVGSAFAQSSLDKQVKNR